MRRALLLAVLVSLAPFAHASSEVVIEEGDDLVTPVGWRGAPLVLGTDCARTDLQRATLAPTPEGIFITLRVRDLALPCEDENAPHQTFGYTLNVLFTDGGEGWANVQATRDDSGAWDVTGFGIVRCEGRVPLPTSRCDFDGEPFHVHLDLASSTFSFGVPFAWDEVEAVWLASVMWDCRSGDSVHFCVSSRAAGPGDRMPDLGERRLDG